MEWNFSILKCEQFVKKDGGSETSQHVKLGCPPGGVAGTGGWLDLPALEVREWILGWGWPAPGAATEGFVCHPKAAADALQAPLGQGWRGLGTGWDSSAWSLGVAFQTHCGRTSPWLGILSCHQFSHSSTSEGDLEIVTFSNCQFTFIPHVQIYSLFSAGCCCRRYLLDQKSPFKLPQINERTLLSKATPDPSKESCPCYFRGLGSCHKRDAFLWTTQKTPCTATPELSVQGQQQPQHNSVFVATVIFQSQHKMSVWELERSGREKALLLLERGLWLTEQRCHCHWF